MRKGETVRIQRFPFAQRRPEGFYGEVTSGGVNYIHVSIAGSGKVAHLGVADVKVVDISFEECLRRNARLFDRKIRELKRVEV